MELFPRNSSDVLITWNVTLPAAFCEGKQIPFFVPPSYEFFSAITGGFLILIGVIGTLQPRLEILLKLMYAGIAVSGVGTVLLHYRRIVIFNFADVYPLLMTLAVGIAAFLDELIFEKRRPMEDGKLTPWKEHMKSELVSATRAFLDAIVFTISMIYMVVGFCLVIYAHLFSFDIVGLYFGVPFAVIALGGMFYLCAFRPQRVAESNHQLRKLRNVATATGIVGIFFKLMDSFFCTKVDVWMFPHPLFHLFTTYATHCFIVFLAFYRAENSIDETDPQPIVYWFLRVYPYIFIPDTEDYIRKVSSKANADIFIAHGPAGPAIEDTPKTAAKKKDPVIAPEGSPVSAPPTVSTSGFMLASGADE